MTVRKWSTLVTFGALVASVGPRTGSAQELAPSLPARVPDPVRGSPIPSAGRAWVVQSPVMGVIGEVPPRSATGPIVRPPFGPATTPSPELRRLETQPYLGTRIRPEPEAEGEASQMRQQIRQQFELHDPAPPSRARHFEWLARKSPDEVQRVGWYGHIREVRAECGGHTVTIEIYPWLRSLHRFSFVVDNVHETYFFDGNTFRLDATDADQVDTSLHVFPVAY